MAQLAEYQSSRDVAVKFKEDLQVFCNSASELNLVLPHWIDFRKGTLEHFKDSPQGMSSASSVLSAAKSAASCLPQHGEHAGLIGSIAAACTLGLHSGYQKGMAGFNNRRLTDAANALKKDKNETAFVEETVKDLMQKLYEVQKDLENCQRSVGGQTEDFVSISQSVDNVLAELSVRNPPMNHGVFLEWVKLLGNIFQQFLSILRQSLIPDSQIEDLLHRNPVPKELDFKSLVANVKACVTAAEEMRNSTNRQAILLQNMNAVMGGRDSRAVTGGPSVRPTSGSDVASDNPLNYPSAEKIHEKTNAIDKWFQKVHLLLKCSIDVAKVLSNLLCDERFPLHT